LDQVQRDIEQQKSEQPKTTLEPAEEGGEQEGVPGEEGAQGLAGTPGGATPGTLQEALARELRLLENRLQNAAKQREEAAQNLARAVSQRERLRTQGLEGALGPDLQEMLDAEIATLEEQARIAADREASFGTQIDRIGATQQGDETGGITRPSSEVIGDLVRGGDGTGLPRREGPGTGGLGGEFGPGTGEEGEGPGAGEEGEGAGGGGGGGAGGFGGGEGGGGEGGGLEPGTPLRPVVIFDGQEVRPVAPFASRVTGEALAGILGAKEPLFGGDPDEQRAVWNRRSLRLRRALGL
jgi:hypothetical protein